MSKPESMQELAQIFRRQMFFYDLAQDAILEEAQARAKAFFMAQKKRSEKLRMDSENREWSDLSVQVRKWRGQVVIYWRIRYWYKARRDGRKRFHAKHLAKTKSSYNYKRAISKEATTEEYGEAIALEEHFIHLRQRSMAIFHARKALLSISKELGIELRETERINREAETAYAIHERMGNLLLLLRHRIWPDRSEADKDAGFVPMVDAMSGLNNVDPRALNDALKEMDSAYEKLRKALLAKN